MSTQPRCMHALRCTLQVGEDHTMRIYTTSNVMPNVQETLGAMLRHKRKNTKRHEIQCTSSRTTCASHFLNGLDTLP